MFGHNRRMGEDRLSKNVLDLKEEGTNLMGKSQPKHIINAMARIRKRCNADKSTKEK